MIDSISKVILDELLSDIIYIPNPGNAGDSFIAHCTYNLFEKLGISYSAGTVNNLYSNKVLICGGGGSLVEPYREMYDFIKRNKLNSNKIIILPQSIRSYADMISMLDSSDHVFCREEKSFEYVKSNSLGCNVHLSHDIAFSWNIQDTLTKIQDDSYIQFNDMGLFLRNSKRVFRRFSHLAISRGDNALYCYRNDNEKTDIDIPSSNFDMSQLFAADNLGPRQSLWATWYMMDMVSRFDRIYTNRLHVAIMSLLLNKKTYVSDNSYGKLKSVLDHSYSGDVGNLVFQDT